MHERKKKKKNGRKGKINPYNQNMEGVNLVENFSHLSEAHIDTNTWCMGREVSTTTTPRVTEV